MLGCSLDEAFGGIKRKKNLRNNHANIISRNRLNLEDNSNNNRIDDKIIIEDKKINKSIENTESELENKNEKMKNDVLDKLNTVLDRLNELEQKFNKSEKESKINVQKLSDLHANKSQQLVKSEPSSHQNVSNTSNLINKLNSLRNRNNNRNNDSNNNSNNSNNSNNNNIMYDSLIEGFSNNNISYVGDQLNELLLFGLMGIFILLLFDYIYKLGKKSF